MQPVGEHELLEKAGARALRAAPRRRGRAAPVEKEAGRAGPLRRGDDVRQAPEPARDAASPDPDGFLGRWQALNRTATIPHCIEQLRSNGYLENFRRLRAPARDGYHGFRFSDSDLYKVLEAVGKTTSVDGLYDLQGLADALRSQ